MAVLATNRIALSTNGAHVCTYKGCERSFKSEQALRMHTMRRHTKKILTRGQLDLKARKGEKGEKKTRKYTKSQDTSLGVHFCPQCGVDLATLQMAYQVALRMKAKSRK